MGDLSEWLQELGRSGAARWRFVVQLVAVGFGGMAVVFAVGAFSGARAAEAGRSGPVVVAQADSEAQMPMVLRKRSAGGGGDEAPPSKPVQDKGLSYLDTLMRLRKVYDLMPWLEPVKGGVAGAQGVQFAAGTAAQDSRSGIVNAPYAIVAEEMATFGVDSDLTPGIPASVTNDLAEYDGLRPEHQPDYSLDWLVAGSLFGGWTKYPSGLFINRGQQHTVNVRARAAVAAGHNAVQYATYRGYRLFDKGSQYPQRTYEEYAALGYHLEPYALPIALVSPVGAAVVSEISGDLIFPSDFVVSGITADYGGGPGALYGGNWTQEPHASARNQLLKIEPQSATAMQPDWVSLPTVAYILQSGSVRWPIPYSVPQDTIWRFKLRKAFADTFSNGATFTFYVRGAKVIKQ